jgi:hypothetical protein
VVRVVPRAGGERHAQHEPVGAGRR